MRSPKEAYLELLGLTQLYLLQDHTLSDRIYDSAETFDYFRRTAVKQPKEQPQQPLPMLAKPVELQPIVPPVPIAKAKPPEPPIPPPVVQVAEAPRNIPEKVKPPEKPVQNRGYLSTEELPPLKPADFSDLRKIMAERLPHVEFIECIPEFDESQMTLPDVLLLSFDDNPEHHTFLSKVAEAIAGLGPTAQVRHVIELEKEMRWDDILKSVKLVIASSSGLSAHAGLQKLHRTMQKQGREYLGNCPLLLMSDVAVYLREPALKRSLWNGIKQHLSVS